MTDFDDILADLEQKLNETYAPPQPAAPKISKPVSNATPAPAKGGAAAPRIPALNTKTAASRPVEPAPPSPELDALVESLNKPSTPKMTVSQPVITQKPVVSAPPKQPSNPNPAASKPSAPKVNNVPAPRVSSNNLNATFNAAPTSTPTPAPTPTITVQPTPPSNNSRLTDSDPVQKVAQAVATTLGRDAASVQQWMDVFKRNEIETVGDLTALRPDDWPRLGLPLRIERAMRDALADTGNNAPSAPTSAPVSNLGAKLPLNTVNKTQPVTNQPLRSPRGSQSGVLCRNCQQPVQGEHLIALGHHYHKEHFTCSGCSKLLQSNQFFADGDVIKCANCIKSKYICCRCGQGMTGTFLRYSDGRYVHQTCLNATKCGKCGFDVSGPQLEALGQTWHAACFSCTRCNVGLSNEFLSVENKPYCKSCVGALSRSRINEPTFDNYGYQEPPRQPMTKVPSNNSINSGNGSYNGNIGGYGGNMSRSNSETGFALNETPRSAGRSYVQEDSLSESESEAERVVCSRCLSTIVDAEYIALSDKQLHKDCFNCDNCEAKLDADNFYEQDGQLLCEICVSVLSM